MPFKVVVTDAQGKVRVKTAAVGGANLDAAGLAEFYIKHNTFPGARDVQVFETDEPLPRKMQDLVAYIKQNAKKGVSLKDVAAAAAEADAGAQEEPEVGVALEDADASHVHPGERSITTSHVPNFLAGTKFDTAKDEPRTEPGPTPAQQVKARPAPPAAPPAAKNNPS